MRPLAKLTKMKIFLKGQPRSGKTTLIAKLLSHVKSKQGFVTEEIKENGQRVGFKLVAADGREAMLASINHRSPFQVSRYFVDVAALDKFIEPLFKFEPDQLLYIDEVGQMELFSDNFKKLVNRYLEAGNNFIDTITSVYSDDFVDKVKTRKDIKILEVTPENRDVLAVNLRF